MTVGEYIRARRMSQAAQELARTNAKVIDIALKYGYDSPDSFTKALSALSWRISVQSQRIRRANAIICSAAYQNIIGGRQYDGLPYW